MTIARRRRRTIDAIAPPAPDAPSGLPGPRPPTLRLGFPIPVGDAPAPDTVTPAGRLRRCTFRRIDRVSPLPQRAGGTQYEVMCLYYGSPEQPMALGDISQAAPVCEDCRASGIFRPDED